MKKNAFLTWCCAVVPGFGQMYQGYMKRGVSLMGWFCADIMAAIVLDIFLGDMALVLLVLLPLIWAYSFFDTFNLRNLPPEQRAAMADDFIPNTRWVNETGINGLLRCVRVGKVLGWALVLFGVAGLAHNFWDLLYGLAWQFSPWLAEGLGRLPGLAAALVVILVGVWMLRGGKKTGGAVTPPARAQVPPVAEEGNDAP